MKIFNVTFVFVEEIMVANALYMSDSSFQKFSSDVNVLLAKFRENRDLKNTLNKRLLFSKML